MKTFSKMIVSLPFLVGLAGLPTISSASETRVEATGGLVTVLPDETSDLNLFLDGNPAGLVLLNSRSRVDLVSQWFDSDQEGPWGSIRRQSFGSDPRLEDDVVRYEGLLLFPSSHWAIQTSGGFASSSGIPAWGSGKPSLSENQYRGFVRAAYASSFGSIGVEILDRQTDLQYASGAYSSTAALTGGSGRQNQLWVKTGVAAAFPSPAPAQDPRWQAGVYFAFPAGSNLTQQTFSLSENGAVPILISQTTTPTLDHSLGAEVIYEVPASLKIDFSAALQNSSADFEQTTSAPTSLFNDQPRFHLSDSQTLNLKGSFRYSLPLKEEQNLKLGGSVGLVWNQTQSLPSGFPNNTPQQQMNILFGLGFEEEKEYTMGLQWKSRSYLSESQISPVLPTTLNPGVNEYQIAFGGEKWLTPTWALRLGLAVEEDDAQKGHLSTMTTSINAGAGWEQVFGRVDFRLRLGQTLDTGNSSNTIGLFNTQLSATIFL